MVSKILILLIFIVSFSVQSATNDFDMLCGYFSRLENVLNHKKMSKLEKADFINEHVIKNLTVNSNARKTWEVVLFAVPEERYDMVKSTADELLKSDWSCPAMMRQIVNLGR